MILSHHQWSIFLTIVSYLHKIDRTCQNLEKPIDFARPLRTISENQGNKLIEGDVRFSHLLNDSIESESEHDQIEHHESFPQDSTP